MGMVSIASFQHHGIVIDIERSRLPCRYSAWTAGLGEKLPRREGTAAPAETRLSVASNVSVRQACVASMWRSVRNSGQLAEEQANAHVRIAVHLGLAGRGRHQMATVLAFVERDAADLDPVWSVYSELVTSAR
jgi:hypothetical protein